ncbi:MAG: hypothetical protein ACXADH_15975, partial [Candidatus Kariarchaeaceae archaeon]
RSSGTGDDTHYWTEKYEYCPLCYGDAKINEARSGVTGGYVGIVVMIFVLGFFSWITNSGGFPLPLRIIFIAFPILIIIALIKQIIDGPGKAERARLEQTAFLNSLENPPQGVKEAYQSSSSDKVKWSKTEMTCFQCGNSLTLQDQFCSVCGDTTEDERAFARKYN